MLFKFILKENRILKNSAIVVTDIVLCNISVWISFYLRLGTTKDFLDQIIFVSIISTIFLIIFKFFNVYRVIIRYINIDFIKDLLKGMLSYTFLLTIIIFIIDLSNLPRSICLIHPSLLFF